MTRRRVYGDFQNLDHDNRLKLTCAGTFNDLRQQGIELHEGDVLTFWTDDADNNGQREEMSAEGTVQFNAEEQCWVAAVDWKALRHASDSKQSRLI